MSAQPLFNPAEHVPLRPIAWSEIKARETANEIFDFLIAGYNSENFWPKHPDEDGVEGFNPSLYNGAVGTLWALSELSRRLNRPLPFEPLKLAQEIYRRVQTDASEESRYPSYLIGETGILSLLHKLDPKPEYLEKLSKLIDDNTENKVMEMLWGSPGTMIVAERLGLENLYRKSADYLFKKWEQFPNGLWYWTQDLYGTITQLVGAGHGFAGNVKALLCGFRFLTPGQQKIVLDRAEITLLGFATREHGLANWSPRFVKVEGRIPPVQWCHGSPGMILSFADYPKGHSPQVEKKFYWRLANLLGRPDPSTASDFVTAPMATRMRF